MHLNECEQRGIPEHLHRKEREEIEFLQLSQEDSVCIRIKPQDWNVEEDRPKLHAIGVEEQSCNLMSMCQAPTDVLYDLNCSLENAYRRDYGVISLNCKLVENSEFHVPNESGRFYRPFFRHKPTVCIYPHCEIWFKEKHPNHDALLVIGAIKPTSVKTAIRKFYQDNYIIHKRPDMILPAAEAI